MGANEKHAATLHGWQYTPSMDAVRDAYVIDRFGSSPYSEDQAEAEFGRFLAKVRAEAKAEAYRDAERILHEEARWQLDLHQRHKEYRFKHCSERMTEMENCMTVRANQYKENQ